MVLKSVSLVLLCVHNFLCKSQPLLHLKGVCLQCMQEKKQLLNGAWKISRESISLGTKSIMSRTNPVNFHLLWVSFAQFKTAFKKILYLTADESFLQWDSMRHSHSFKLSLHENFFYISFILVISSSVVKQWKPVFGKDLCLMPTGACPFHGVERNANSYCILI